MRPATLMQYTSDASLLFAAARSRDGEAIAQLAQRYAALVYSVALRITAEPARAERLTVEVFGIIAAKPERVRGEPAVWIHEQITRRARELMADTVHPPRVDPAEEPGWDEVRHALDKALLRLSARNRNVVLQHYYQRHSQDDLAEMLQVTQPVVGKRLRKGLELLRGKLVEADAGCSLGHLMMLLARYAASDAPPQLIAKARAAAVDRLEASPEKRGGWLGILAVWAVVAGLIVAVAASYSRTPDAAKANTTTMPSSR